jgi:alpha-ribazole phosphatase
MIYLIRHTTPLIDKGVCYGQTDIDVTETFHQEAATIRKLVPDQVQKIYSSPLLRCRKLVEYLYPGMQADFDNSLREVHCGDWEMQRWDDIPRDLIDPWMNDFVNVSFPGGESYVQLYSRVIQSFESMIQSPKPVAIVTHAGVIRSILSHITNTPLKNSFGVFGLHYGCVVRVEEQEGKWRHEMLSINTSEKEQHKPSYFQRSATK